MKKIALVHDFLFKLGGAERVLKVLSEMFPEAPIFTLFFDEERCGKVFPKDRIRTSNLQHSPRWVRRHPQLLFSAMPQAIESFDFSGFDLVISSSGAFSHGAITGPGTKHLCYCHSPMRYAWDYTHEYLAEKKLPGFLRFFLERKLSTVRLWDSVASDRPDRYLANSKHTAKRLKKYYRVDAPIVYPPVDISRFSVSSEHEDYFVVVSALTTFKKIDLAILACNALKKKLVIVGDGQEVSALKKISGPTIEFLGKVSDETLSEILKKSRALIFPGEEDFGIAPIEAMACGKPVIAYGKGGVTESVSSGVHGLHFPDPTVESLISCLEQFENMSFVPSALRQRAEEFSPEKFQTQLLHHIHELRITA